MFRLGHTTHVQNTVFHDYLAKSLFKLTTEHLNDLIY